MEEAREPEVNVTLDMNIDNGRHLERGAGASRGLPMISNVISFS